MGQDFLDERLVIMAFLFFYIPFFEVNIAGAEMIVKTKLILINKFNGERFNLRVKIGKCLKT